MNSVTRDIVPADRPMHKRSPHDGWIHVFDQQRGTVAESLCGIGVEVEKLEEPTEDDPRCAACLAAFGALVSKMRRR